METVIDQWVDGQKSYYCLAAGRRRSVGTWLNRIAQGCFVLGLLLAAAKPLFRGNAVLTAAIGLAGRGCVALHLCPHARLLRNRRGSMTA